MKRALSIGVVALSLVGLSARNSQAALINFDDVASGTLINTQYSALGVTFSCTDGSLATDLCSGGNVYAVTAVSPASSPNVLSLASNASGVFTDDRYGTYKATFSGIVTSVSIDAKAVYPPEYAGPKGNEPILQAFSSTGTLLGTASYAGDTDLGLWETLSISGVGNIAYVTFTSTSSSGHIVYGEFDNLNFTGGTTGGGGDNGGGGTPVPEPASLAMLSLGLATVFRKAKSA